MRTTRHPLRPCSVRAAVPLCRPTLGCVATAVRMCISATSAGEQQVKKGCEKYLYDWRHWSCILNWWLFYIRSINYDEKDPFLCNACGFCKYARFDFMLYAKPCCAVDPIENEEDRKKVSSHCLGNASEMEWKSKWCLPFKKSACVAK